MMGHAIIAVLLFIAAACDRSVHGERDMPAAPTELEQVYAADLEELRALPNSETLGPVYNDCDGAEWRGLAHASGATWVDFLGDELAGGTLGRRPASHPRPCYPEASPGDGSRASTSQDMALGHLWGIWRSRDLARLQRFAAYGEAHRKPLPPYAIWVIGEPWPEMASRVTLRPGMIGLIGRMLERLSGGADLRSYRSWPNIYSADGASYQKHLTALSIALHGEVDGPSALAEEPKAKGAIDGSMLDVVKRLRAEQPQDWVFAALHARYVGDYEGALALLTDPAIPCPPYADSDSPSGGEGSGRVKCLVTRIFAARLLMH